MKTTKIFAGMLILWILISPEILFGQDKYSTYSNGEGVRNTSNILNGNDSIGMDFIDFNSYLPISQGLASIRSYDRSPNQDVDEDKRAIMAVIQEALIDGYINNYDLDAMERGIHSEFRIMEMRNDSLSQRNYKDLVVYVERVKPLRPEGRRVKVTIDFKKVEVLGSIGCAMVEFYDGPTLHGTDFIILLKFYDGWKLMGSVAYENK